MIGSIECRLVNDGHSGPLERSFFNAESADLSAGLHFESEDEEIVSPYNCLLLRSPSDLVLVDTGLGVYAHDFGATAGKLSESLAREGVSPLEIDQVVITHGHADHIGGLTVRGTPVFSNARHTISRTEWEFWTSPRSLAEMPEPIALVAREQLPPLEQAGLLDTFDGDVELLGGVRAVEAPGHTPGHAVVEIEASMAGALFLSDGVLHELNFEHPDWVSVVDMDPALTVVTRRSLLERAARENLVVAAFHLNGVGRIEQLADYFRFHPVDH